MGAYSREEIEVIYRRHFKLVYQVCLVLMKNAPDAEDAVQTVFRRAMERGEPFRDPEHERAWLIVTARNECRDQLKHWWRRCREDASALDTLTWEEPSDGLVWMTPPSPAAAICSLARANGPFRISMASACGHLPLCFN